MESQKGSERSIRATRTRVACRYCQMKKIKCDAARPTCSSCRSRGLECVLRESAPPPRPTNWRINQLERENRRLNEIACRVQSDNTAQSHASSPDEVAQCSSDPEPTTEKNPRIDERVIVVAESPDDEHSAYHGPTSAFFKDSPRFTAPSTAASSTTLDVGRINDRLVAQASKQRQLESLNLTLLDFDGLDPELGMDLLSLYWSRQLHAGMIVYRPVFMRDMACNGPYFSKLLLNAIYYSSSKHSPCKAIRKDPNDPASSGWAFRDRFQNLLGEQFDRSRLTTIQALLIMASSLFTRCDEKSTSWLYAGQAFNMIYDLGLHDINSCPNNVSDEEMETRRRVFWAAYMIDKILCLYQGRHPCLRITDANIPLQFIDNYEELEQLSTESFLPVSRLHPTPSYCISILTKYCELALVMEQIQNKLYSIGNFNRNRGDLIVEALSLEGDLTNWRNGLPAHMNFQQAINTTEPAPHNISLMALYHVSIILVNRAILSNDIYASGRVRTADEALMICLESAHGITSILHTYGSLYSPESAPFPLSYATCVCAKLLVNVLAKHGNIHGTSASLSTCLNALERHQMIYSASRRARSAILFLLAQVDVSLSRQGNIAETISSRSHNMETEQIITTPEITKIGPEPAAYSDATIPSIHDGSVALSRSSNGNLQGTDQSPRVEKDLLPFSGSDYLLGNWPGVDWDLSLDDLYQSTGFGF